MTRALARTKASKERGMALLLTLFALLLLSAIGLSMVLSSNTETKIDANYGSDVRAYYAASSGLEEVRDRIKYPVASGGLADRLPQDIAGNPNGVLYVLNPANGETVDPTDVTSPYFDDDLCHTYNSGTPKGIKCTAVPTIASWQLGPQFSQAPATGPLGYKWIRVNMKTNRIADPYFVDQGASGAPLDTRVCWDGLSEQLSPGGTDNPGCDANGMQTVYMLTSLAVTPGSGPKGARKLLQAEVVAPSIRPAGALTAASMNLVISPTATIPPVAIDGRVHKLDGTVDGGSSCSSVAPLATNTGSGQMEQALNQIRKSIVDNANNSCNADGSAIGSNSCTPGLWWVRGTNTTTRFVTSVTSGTPGGSGGDDHSGHGDGHHHDPTGVTTSACDSTNPACYTNLDLSAAELFAPPGSATFATPFPHINLPLNAPAPFIGNSGNQADSTIYQPPLQQTVVNQVATVSKLVLGSQNSFSLTSATLSPNATFGTSSAPAVVNFTDPTLTVTGTLTGYGVLMLSNPNAAMEISGTLNWTGIVLVNSAASSTTGHVTVNSGATGSINGALLLAPGAIFNFPTSGGPGPNGQPLFTVTYSCDAIDMAFSMLPFKVISTAETSF